MKIDAGMSSVDDEVRNVIIQNSISLPVTNGKPGIGVWQGIYLWDKSKHAAERKLTVTVVGE